LGITGLIVVFVFHPTLFCDFDGGQVEQIWLVGRALLLCFHWTVEQVDLTTRC
jgi:hypothetical protein